MSEEIESLPTEIAQLILQNVSILSELSSQLRKETKHGEQYLCSLQHLLQQAGKDISSLHQSIDSLTIVAKKLVYLSLQIVPRNDMNFKTLQAEGNKLLSILDEIGNHEEEQIMKIQSSLKRNLSSKSVNLLEKYPEHCSRESLLGDNVVSLPTVHEDVFSNFFVGANRSLSSSSLKNLRKVKLCLQKVKDVDDAETMTGETSEETSSKVCCLAVGYNLLGS